MGLNRRREPSAELRALQRRLEELERRFAARTRELELVSTRLQTMIEELPQGVLFIEGNGGLPVANRRAQEIFGVAREQLAEVVQRPPWVMFDAGGRRLENAERPIVRALEREESTIAERFMVERPDGERLVIELTAIPVREPGGGNSVIVTVQDVTARARRELAERDFVTNAAHELQTPLAAITSAVDVLEAGAKDRPEDRDRFLNHIARACARLDRLTRALLVLARAQMDAEPPRTEIIAVAPLLETIASLFGRDRDIEIVCDEGLAVVANRPLLEQALANLGHNAIKHTDGRVVLAARRKNGRVRISVRDSGHGIADAR